MGLGRRMRVWRGVGVLLRLRVGLRLWRPLGLWRVRRVVGLRRLGVLLRLGGGVGTEWRRGPLRPEASVGALGTAVLHPDPNSVSGLGAPSAGARVFRIPVLRIPKVPFPTAAV
ncbi:hypothetical protein GCM10009863_03110 [Streptomyces axinellae]|uniref:Uncharacterized protein n=1 Tax=Streptomyces axinellae TaxID=552788 RepID=A0ABN3PM90_9ACTN